MSESGRPLFLFGAALAGCMNHKLLQEQLHRANELPERSRFCPEDQVMASYYDARLAEPARQALQRHVADCRYCQARLGMLARLEQVKEEHVSEQILAEAKRLTDQPGQRRFGGVSSWLAAAAVLVLATGLVLRLTPLTPQADGEIVRPAGEFKETRGFEPQALASSIQAPQLRIDLAAPNQALSWTTIPGSLYYEVRIVSDDGYLVWQERVPGNSWALPAALRLEPGLEYYARVEAKLDDFRTLKSNFVPFRTAADR